MEDTIEKLEREKGVLDFCKKKFNWITYILLSIIILINVYIRTLPMRINSLTGKPGLWDITRDNWTLGPDLDPFFFLRWAKMILENGSLPLNDAMRFVPLGYNTLLETKLLPYSIVYLYKFLHLFSSNVTIEYAAVILPVVASVFMIFGFFILVRKIFENEGKNISNIIALVASMFLATIPSLLGRTVAGIPEKESLGFALMFFAFYFFICACKSNFKKAIFFSIISGIFTALMGLIWGGVIFVFITIALTGFIVFLFREVNLKFLVAYSLWMFSSLLFWMPFTMRIGLSEFLQSSSGSVTVAVWFIMVVHFLMSNTKIGNFKIFNNKIPKKIYSILVASFILILSATIIFGPTTVTSLVNNIVSELSNPYTARISYTVAENKQPYFQNWAGNFGPMFNGIPLGFWLFLTGSIYVFYNAFNVVRKKEKIILTGGYSLFLSLIIFSRYSPSSVLNGTNLLSIILYISGYIFLIGSFCYVAYSRYKKNESNIFKNISVNYIFLFSLIFIGIISGRSAVRLIMFLSAISIIPLSYMVVTLVSGIFKKREDIYKLFYVVITILILLSSIYTLSYNYNTITSTAKVYIPNSYTMQWQKAMGWVRATTQSDSVFAHWWDYGYWVQTMGERATMLDGGNNIGYWNYLMGRHVLTANNESEALELLYNHDVSHFLIDSTELAKYGAYSSIGSDEEYDKLSWIGSFIVDETKTTETKNETTKFYFGGAVLDEDIIINQNGKDILLPSGKAGVGAIVIKSISNFEFGQPQAIMVYDNKQYWVDLRYLSINGNIVDFGSGIEATAFVFPLLQETQINPTGAALFLSPRNMRALWVKMYLLDETENFNLVHSESNEIINQLRRNGIKIGEFVYYGGFQGPIKIWEVNYTGEEIYNEEYVQRTFPERIAGRWLQ